MSDFINIAELERGIDSGKLVLVEALPEPHYARGHLPGAVVLPLDALAKNAAGKAEWTEAGHSLEVA